MPVEKVSFKEFARRLGYSDAMVPKWIAKGIITEKNIDRSRPQRPQIYFHAAEAEFRSKHIANENSKPEKRKATRHNKAARMEARNVPFSYPANARAISSVIAKAEGGMRKRQNPWDLDDSEPDELPEDPYAWADDIDFTKQLTTPQMLRMTMNDLDKLKKIREIQKLEQAHAKESKQLVAIDEVDKALFEAGKMLRGALSNIPARVVDELIGAEDREAAIILLEDELDSALTYLNNVGESLPR